MHGGEFPILVRRNNKSERRYKNTPPILSECIAKLVIDDKDTYHTGLNVETHCKIVGLVAKEIIAKFPDKIKKILFPDGVELIAASHDVGKVNPHFQEKLKRMFPDYIPNSNPCLKDANPDIEKNIGMHSGVSQVALQGTGTYIPEIVGMHHGSSPDSNYLLPDDLVLGGIQWQSTRNELIKRLKIFFHQDWPMIRDNIQANVVAGLTTVADWIGSGFVFENLQELEDCQYRILISEAVERAGFVPLKINRNLSFEEVFPSYTPKPIQKALYENVQVPGIYIMESLMGSGKTEAALYAAYLMIERGHANGIYFALPTRITSEKIQDRMKKFLDTILSSDDKHRSKLLHSTAWMFESEIGEDARPGYEWFDSRKRGLLSPFAVGTIDQALMAVMNVRHSSVRAFGLAGKVVILDEVHTYDAYTGTIMDNLINALREMGSTVILLSATLTTERKIQFFTQQYISNIQNYASRYPLITSLAYGNSIEFSNSIEEASYTVKISITDDELQLRESVRDKALSGEYILWIENTVDEAQSVYKFFASWGKEQGIGVGLIHSRFPAIKRSELESDWVASYGRQGLPKRKDSGKILIGTQVLEQSLDLDSDLLVTRIAPTDMLLQRIGRLWRHSEMYPGALRPKTAQRQVYILSPDLESVLKNPKWKFGLSGKVYAPYVLARTLMVFSVLESIVIPNDMRNLIEETYSDCGNESSSMAEAKQEIIEYRKHLQSFANNSMAIVGKPSSDNIVTRFSDVPTCDVLILLDGSDMSNGELKFIDGELLSIPKDIKPNKNQKKQIARSCMLRIISVPQHIAPRPNSFQELSVLTPYLYIADSEEERLRIAILHPSGKIHGLLGRDANEKFQLEYSSMYGYLAKKKEDV